MNITDNLKKDISNAPEWFLDAIASESEVKVLETELGNVSYCLLYTSPSPRDATLSRMPSSA